MKKIFSLFMVAAIVLTMSFAAMAAEPVSGMKFLVTETDSDITVSVIVGNYTNLTGFTASLGTSAVTYVADSYVNKSTFEKVTPTMKTGIIQFALATTDAANYVTNAGDMEAFTFKVVKVDESKELSAADFAHASATLNYSKMTCTSDGVICGIANPGNNFTNKKQASYFTVEYVDERTPVGGGEGGDSTPVYEASKEEIVTAAGSWTGSFTYKPAEGETVGEVGKKVAAFGKNAGTEAFTEGNYGIKIGNRFYPGKGDVPAGSYFAIIVINSKSDAAIENSYTYSIYKGTDSNPEWLAENLAATVE